MARKRNPVGQWLIYAVTRTLGAITRRLPLGATRWLGRLIGRTAYYLVPRVRRVSLYNLDLAYGDTLSRSEKIRIAKGASENVGIVATEFSRIPLLVGDTVERLVRVVGRERVDRSRGTFMVSAHIGNWEWMGAAVRSQGWETAEVVRPLDFPALNAYIDATRKSCGIHTIDKDASGPELFRLLRDGWVAGVLADQSPRENAVPVTFFGQNCWATIAPAMVAARARVPIHVVSMVRQPDGTYVLEFSEPIELARTGNLREDLVLMSQQCQDEIERLVRAHPEQWLWLHRRWKARPRLQQEWDAKARKERKASPAAKQDAESP